MHHFPRGHFIQQLLITLASYIKYPTEMLMPQLFKFLGPCSQVTILLPKSDRTSRPSPRKCSLQLLNTAPPQFPISTMFNITYYLTNPYLLSFIHSFLHYSLTASELVFLLSRGTLCLQIPLMGFVIQQGFKYTSSIDAPVWLFLSTTPNSFLSRHHNTIFQHLPPLFY